MAMTDPARRCAQSGPISAFGPAVIFAMTVAIAFGVLLIATATVPRDFVMPAVSSLFFLFAAAVALAAWLVGHGPDRGTLSYWDVAGALTLFGIFSGILIEPEQLVRIVETQRLSARAD